MARNLWKSYSFTVQVSDAGSTGADMLSYDAQLSRVRVDLAGTVVAPTSQTFTGTVVKGARSYGQFTVPDGLATLTLSLTGGKDGDDLDLFLYQGSHTAPVQQWQSTHPGTSESITVTDPPPGTYEYGVDGYEVTSIANPGFESGTTGWVVNGGTLTTASTGVWEGAAAGKLTPAGGVTAQAITPVRAVTAGTAYTWKIHAYSVAGYGSVTADIDWLAANGTYLSTTIGTTLSVPAATDTILTVSATAPAGAGKASGKVSVRAAPTSAAVLYLDGAQLAAGTGTEVFSAAWSLGMVQTPPGVPPPGATWRVQRSVDLIRWATVRGGDSIPVTAAATPLDDYEFAPNAQNHYRVQIRSGATLVHTLTDAITPLADEVWLKHIAYPFLNRVVDVADASDMARRARGGVFDIVGRSLPVAVTDVRGSLAFTLTLTTVTAAGADDLDVLLSTGDPVYLQTPAGHPVPAGYYTIGDTSRSWRGGPPAQMPNRWFELPLTGVAAPAPSVVGATTTWQAVVNTYPTWTDLEAAAATWNDVTQAIANPGDVITT